MQLNFVASNAFTVISFGGQGLESLDNESWGLDNVHVQLTSTLLGPSIWTTTLPLAGSTSSVPVESFIVAANEPLLASTATNAANFSMREAGGNGVLGDGDDTIFALTPSLPGGGGRSVNLALANVPLQPGHYRFQTLPGLLDTNSSPVALFTNDFVIVSPVVGKIENTSNDTLAEATLSPVTDTPTASGFFTAYGIGTLSSTSDVDYWRFNAEAGDHVSIWVQADSLGVYPRIYLQNASGSNLTTANGDYAGNVGIQNYAFSSPGTYYIRVFSDNNRSRYRLRLDLGRKLQLETEANDAQSSANALNLSFSPGLSQGAVAGALPTTDSAGDFFKLGTLNVGNVISVNASFPDGSTLTATQLVLTVQIDGNAVALTNSTSGSLNYTVVSNGIHYVRIESAQHDFRAQYVLNVAVSDGVPPAVTTTTLPAEGTTSTGDWDRFSVSFTEDLRADTVTNSANYDLRVAGPDGNFNTGDDILYSVANTGYTSGLTASYYITDGPLQPGQYRFTVQTGISDRANNNMAAPFVLNFTVANYDGFVLENRNDDVAGLASTFSLTPSSVPDGTFSYLTTLSLPSQTHFVTSARLNGDTNLDLVVANYGGDNMSVLLNDGTGNFQTVTNVSTGNGAVALALGDLNGDAHLDAAVANYSANTVTILLGNGAGGFQILTNYTGFSNPYNLAAADFDHDGKLDLAIPNYSGGSITVMLGVGDGTFQSRSNYTAGSNPMTVAVGDLNNDNKLDLVVPNYGSGSASLFFGNGDGTFQSATNVTTSVNPRYAIVADVTGNNVPDIVVAHADGTVSVLAGNGNGTFQTIQNYASSSTDVYQFRLSDFNGDNHLDAAVAGYGNNTFTVMLNDGTGGFANTYGYSVSGSPIGLTVGDFNGDGRNDLATVGYSDHNVIVWLGNNTNPLVEDPSGSGIRTGLARGNLFNSSDTDLYRFTGTAGDLVTVAMETPGSPGSSGLRIRIERYDGYGYQSFYTDGNGRGASGPFTLPYTGSYYVRVTYNYDYQGEYRLRVTTVSPPLQMESEDNNNLSQADPVSFVFTNGHQVASIAAYLAVNDSSGDYYNLGNLSAGTLITLSTAEPSDSGLAPLLWIYDAAGNPVTNSAASPTNFAYAVQPGQDGAFYVRVTAAAKGYSDKVESALFFDGSNDSADLGNWFDDQVFTISMWLNPGSSQVNYADILDNNHQAISTGPSSKTPPAKTITIGRRRMAPTSTSRSSRTNGSIWLSRGIARTSAAST